MPVVERSYVLSLRVCACAGCGAPLEVPEAGGTITCGYCGRENWLERRRARSAVGRSEAEHLSESERLQRLRSQEARGEPLPSSLAPYLNERGQLHHAPDGHVAKEWVETRASLDAAPSFALSERLFYLTLGLVPHCEPRRRRAILETALELLPDRAHRQALHCTLSRLAARSGDLEAAEQWLGLCEPRSSTLSMDTAYRYARATISTAREEYPQVLVQLGTDPGDVPLASLDALSCSLLRAHALECQGSVSAARRQLDELSVLEGEVVILRALDACLPLRMCGRWRQELARRYRANRIGELSRRRLALTLRMQARERFSSALANFIVTALLMTFVAVVLIDSFELSDSIAAWTVGAVIVALSAGWFAFAAAKLVLETPRRQRRLRALGQELADVRQEGS